MFRPTHIVLACLLALCVDHASAYMDCGDYKFLDQTVRLRCPNDALYGPDKEYCCDSDSSKILKRYCCDANEYIGQHPGIVAGIVIGVLLLVGLPILCCICCFCACCPIYQRRVQRGTVVYTGR